MMKIMVIVSLVVLEYSGFSTAAQEVGSASQPVTSDPSNASDLAPFLWTLQQTIDSTTASKTGEKLDAQLQAMRIPDYQTWFSDTFEVDNGNKLSSVYSATQQKNESRLIEYFVAHAPAGGQIAAELVSDSEDQQSAPFLQQVDKAIRQSLKRPTLFYRLKYKWNSDKPGTSIAQPIGYIALVAGNYRLLGDNVISALPNMPALRIRQGGAVVAKSLISRVQPTYPEEARRKRISGVVRLHAIIGTDGAISKLELVSGEPRLVQAAGYAVQQWRYRPTTLNGQPVEIDTTIDVIFSLNPYSCKFSATTEN